MSADSEPTLWQTAKGRPPENFLHTFSSKCSTLEKLLTEWMQLEAGSGLAAREERPVFGPPAK